MILEGIILISLFVFFVSLPWLGDYLLAKGQTLRARRIGWFMLYTIDVAGHAGLTDGSANDFRELDRRFTERYGPRP